ncbi:MAG: S8 family serine peptidase [Bradyrhizobium sp.]|uniref:S8 family serine peptidase n=1 Tax=Bradyrhizobium sp. TaxID=376 RepID=UPI0025C24C4D|nr:S8 family serine peptidase [Bradyrhizobium sp.]MBI5264660.1 S8 family serine peptidase [Bradyrhizobium sp.]
MRHNFQNFWKAGAQAATLTVALALLGGLAHAQSVMRPPSVNVPIRTPVITPSPAPHINPGLAGRVGNAALSRTPAIRNTPRPSCGSANRDGDGQCLDQSNGGSTSGKKGSGNSRALVQADKLRIPGELVAEIDSALSGSEADELARRHGLERIGSQDFPLIRSTVGLFRITDGRSLEAVQRELAGDGSVRAVQPNFRYRLQDQKSEPVEGDPAQYALAKLRLPVAHKLARGANVTIAVIDSGVDTRHNELANSIADTFDALGSSEGPHLHGTGVAGVIVSHARLMGSAPEARIIAIRAFGVAKAGAESNSYVILKALNYAAEHGAQIVNMSFAGPKDPVIERAIAATAARGLVLVAAAGNAGAKSPPLYPAANPNVIAVSATDAQDKLFAASNRGNYIAIAAPGVDIFLPAPDGKYQMTSGTSFSAAYISGIAALLLERSFALTPEQLRAALTRTARDLGAPGRDDQFGAGAADAYAAVMAVPTDASTPIAAAPTRKRDHSPAPQEAPPTRAMEQRSPSMAAEKSTLSEGFGASAH